MKMVFITEANCKVTCDPVHPRSLARTFAIRSHTIKNCLRQRAGYLAYLGGYAGEFWCILHVGNVNFLIFMQP